MGIASQTRKSRHATFAIESLELRRLLSGAITAVGSPITVATVPGQYVPLASCPIGTSDLFIAYENTGVCYGSVLNSSGGVVVPAFAISTSGQKADVFPMAAAQDSSGNAVLVYSVVNSTMVGDNLYIARIGDAGTIVNAPALVTSTASGDQTYPAVAIGANNSVAVVFENQPAGGSNSTTVFARVFDTNDNPAFVETLISAVGTAATQYQTTPSVVYLTGGNFLAAWNETDFNSSNLTTNVTIDDCTFSPSGVVGTAASGLTQTPTASTLNNLTTPVLYPNTDGTADLFTTQVLYDGSANYQGANILVTTISAAGAFTGAPVTLDSVTSPTDETVTQAVLPSSVAAATTTTGSVLTTAAAPKGPVIIPTAFLDINFARGTNGLNGLTDPAIWNLAITAGNKIATAPALIYTPPAGESLNPDSLSLFRHFFTFETFGTNSNTIQVLGASGSTDNRLDWSLAATGLRDIFSDSLQVTVSLSAAAPFGGATVVLDLGASTFSKAHKVPIHLKEGEKEIVLDLALDPNAPSYSGQVPLSLSGNDPTATYIPTPMVTVMIPATPATLLKFRMTEVADKAAMKAAAANVSKTEQTDFKWLATDLKTDGDQKAAAETLQTFSKEETAMTAAITKEVSKASSEFTSDLSKLATADKAYAKNPSVANLLAKFGASETIFVMDTSTGLTTVTNLANGQQSSFSGSLAPIINLDPTSAQLNTDANTISQNLMAAGAALVNSTAQLLSTDVTDVTAQLIKRPM